MADEYVPPLALRRAVLMAQANQAWHEKMEKAVPKERWFGWFQQIHLQWDQERDFHRTMGSVFNGLAEETSNCCNKRSLRSMTSRAIPSCSLATIEVIHELVECSRRQIDNGGYNPWNCAYYCPEDKD